ncbi:MAG: TonB family protein [Gammaproteobacteria bacterium]|nr:TonB family protein [Gammaproteobacteria bacterium]NNF66281.1 energy transducer TonB [Gammaproteobacteria bacterium]
MSIRRFLAALTMALLVTTALFWLMQKLVNIGDREAGTTGKETVIERIKIVDEPPPPPPPPVRQPQAPETVTAKRQSAALSIAPVDLPLQDLPVPQMTLNFQPGGRLQSPGLLSGVATGDALAAFAAGEEGFEGKDLVPISSARPRYPRAAAEREIEGWVEVIFVVAGNGKVSNIRVLDASPRGIFEDAAVYAMSRWLYAPFYLKGKPVAREATQIFYFTLDDIQDLYLWDD